VGRRRSAYPKAALKLGDSGSWQSATFKDYNFGARGAPPNGGALHPLLKVRSEFREIFFEMGCASCTILAMERRMRLHSFSEMPTNRFVESGFWNFDTLFVPQQHPARELQDTFYISGALLSRRCGAQCHVDA
jgi:phenylalanyl-tRNA synthetase alpha chain